jgi:hypothetical protein
MNTTVPVVSEKYDEVVFTNPKVEFHNLLLSANSTKPEYPLSNEPANLEYFRTYGDEEDVQRMLAAKEFLEGELRSVRDRLLKADKELEEIKTSLALVKEGEAKTASVAAAATAKDAKAKNTKTESKPKSKKKAASSGEQSVAKKAKTDSKVKAEPTKSTSDPAASKKTKTEPTKTIETSKAKHEPEKKIEPVKKIEPNGED